jgi:Domain of Unknown Function (DUF1206)
MRSISIAHVRRRARRARESRAARVVARAGLTARGIIYLLIGWIAVLVALGRSSREADQQGALQLLASKPYGSVSLWLLGIGFAAYALWRLSEAAYGVTGEGKAFRPRLDSLSVAVIYAGLAFLTLAMIAGSQGGPPNQAQDLTDTVMQHPGGRWLVGIAGVVVIIVGLDFISLGYRQTFMKYLLTSQMRRRTRHIVRALGIIGTVARGLVVAVFGILVVDAAVSHDSAKVGGVDNALLALRDEPFGPVVLLLVASGLFVFGVYALCEARWRRV